MQNYRISLNDLSPEGKEFTLDDAAIWQEPMDEFGLDFRVSKPPCARILVLPTDGGWLVRGTLEGEVVLPCSRCAEDSVAVIAARFEDFENMPGMGEDEDESDESVAPAEMEETTDRRIVFEHNSPLLDLAAICWEELMLALPVTPLCRKDCKGLCAGCGVNLNEGMCACTEEEGDPRMAALRGLTLHKN